MAVRRSVNRLWVPGSTRAQWLAEIKEDRKGKSVAIDPSVLPRREGRTKPSSISSSLGFPYVHRQHRQSHAGITNLQQSFLIPFSRIGRVNSL
jgi:hypothetical protein